MADDDPPATDLDQHFACNFARISALCMLAQVLPTRRNVTHEPGDHLRDVDEWREHDRFAAGRVQCELRQPLCVRLERAVHLPVRTNELASAHGRHFTGTSPACGETSRTILPTCWLDSIRACAPAASASGKRRKSIGLTRPASSNGQTFSRSCFAIAVLNSTERGRNVEPVIVRRRRKMVARFTLAEPPPRTAMIAILPSSATHSISRGT